MEAGLEPNYFECSIRKLSTPFSENTPYLFSEHSENSERGSRDRPQRRPMASVISRSGVLE